LLRYDYRIFGGPAGEHLLALLQDLRAPVGTTLHTVLREPRAAPRRATIRWRCVRSNRKGCLRSRCGDAEFRR